MYLRFVYILNHISSLHKILCSKQIAVFKKCYRLSTYMCLIWIKYDVDEHKEFQTYLVTGPTENIQIFVKREEVDVAEPMRGIFKIPMTDVYKNDREHLDRLTLYLQET